MRPIPKMKINKIQLEVARITMGATKQKSINNFYKETGWEPLEQRRKNINLHKKNQKNTFQCVYSIPILFGSSDCKNIK